MWYRPGVCNFSTDIYIFWGGGSIGIPQNNPGSHLPIWYSDLFGNSENFQI